VVRAVYVHVAVQARAAHHELERPGIASVRAGGMARLDVALLTQSWLRHLEHALVVRAVRVVAARAVLDDGRVLPQEGPSLLGVAPEAVVVRRVLREKGRRDRPVRIVARRAAHLALAQGHVRRAELRGSLLLVARAARLDLCRLRKL